MSRKDKRQNRQSGPSGVPERRAEPVVVASDDREPVAENRPVPVLLIAALVALLFWGDMYIMRNGGDVGGQAGAFSAKIYYPFRSYVEVRNANPKLDGGLFDLGRDFYASKGCAACHQPNGAGSPGQGVPPLAESEWVNTPNPERAIRIVLNGLTGPIEVKGTPWNNTMVAWRDTLTDEQIAAILTYVRGTWGNKAPPVKPENVKAVREATQNRNTYWTAPELLQVPEQ